MLLLGKLSDYYGYSVTVLVQCKSRTGRIAANNNSPEILELKGNIFKPHTHTHTYNARIIYKSYSYTFASTSIPYSPKRFMKYFISQQCFRPYQVSYRGCFLAEFLRKTAFILRSYVREFQTY